MNLIALSIKFIRMRLILLKSASMTAGAAVANSTLKVKSFCGRWAAARCALPGRSSAQPRLAPVKHHDIRLDARHVKHIIDQHEQLLTAFVNR